MKHSRQFATIRAVTGLGLAMLLVACGGGDAGDPSVTNMGVVGQQYGGTMTINVSGFNLADGNTSLEVDGCESVTALASTATQGTYTCSIVRTGAISPVVRAANGVELARVRVSVPIPQVTMRIDGAGTSGATGSVVVELDPVAAPVTVLNFIRHVRQGYYSNTIFHRVLRDQIAQGGYFRADRIARAALFEPITLESNNGLQNLRGTIAMARTSEPNSATSQFYFNIVDNPGFDRVDDTNPGYAVFGKVVSGQEVIDAIGKVETRALDAVFASLPVNNIVLTSATQTR
jgi:peptidyl-prolyl cis-trans isomerase A (cyclophilin A)